MSKPSTSSGKPEGRRKDLALEPLPLRLQLGVRLSRAVAKTIRLAGRPSRAIEEHRELIELIARREEKAAQQLMELHILSASEDIVRLANSQRAPVPSRAEK